YIAAYLRDEHDHKQSKIPLQDLEQWRQLDSTKFGCLVPRQDNSYDCGVFMCMFAEALACG
ncbi:hypothetical protein Pmar_PMAR015457, partial [Perkinsus marinus ATCC 50983]